jgi:predicted regulator of Ras-like GTPase activity (Roadblock/LC7/MglB family)
MARLKRRENLIPFVLVFGLGFMAIGAIPPMFADQIIEVPAFVVVPAEIAIALIMSVLLFENASPPELVRISLIMIGFTMAIGTFGNVMTRTTQGMPDGTLLLNWVQLTIMNVAGILSTVGYYTTKAPQREAAVEAEGEAEEPVISKEELQRIKAETLEEEQESAAEILAKLDPGRFESIERGNPAASSMISNAALAKPRQLTPEELAEALETEAELDLKLEDESEKQVSAFDSMLQEAVAELTVPSEAPPPPPQPAAAEEKKGGLFNITDDDMGGLFDNIVADPSVTKDAIQGGVAQKALESPPKVEAEPQKGGLFSVSDDDIGGIFDNLVADPSVTKDDLKGEGKPAAAAAAATPTPAPAAGKPSDKKKKGKEVKDFGRLSATATNKAPEGPVGTLKTIGQMLLDTQAVEGLIKSAEGRDPSTTTAKVVTVDKGADIQALLNKIASYPGTNGSLVIGKDGLLVGATESLGFMKDVLGPLSLAMQSTTKLGTAKLDMGELQQIVFKSGDKLTVLTEVGMGVLAVFSDAYNQSSIDGLLEWIQTSVAESGSVGEAPTAELGSIFSAKPDAASAKPVSAPPPVEPEEKDKEEPTRTPAPAAKMAGEKSGLFNVSDDDIGGIFDNIVADPNVTKDKVGGEPAETPAKEGMDFSPEEKEQEAAAASADADSGAPEPAGGAPGKNSSVKEFGRLAAGTAAPAKDQEVGTIKSIGRQLIDVQAVENIIKSGEKKGEKIGSGLTTARVISSARGEGIKMLLQKIDTAPGVVGSLIVGNDGLVIASTLGSNMDKDTLGVLCTAMHSHTELAVKKLEMGKLRQIIFHTDDKLTVLTAVAVGVLAVFVEHHDVAKIDDLLMAIEQTVRG